MADATSELRKRNKPQAQGSSAAASQHIDRSRHDATRSQSLQIRPDYAFVVLFAAHTLAALYHPIQDCDETFNYWEPTHYLTHGHGFQTWEYSPDYAIRSWAYAGLHAVFTLPGKLIGSKIAEFYSARIILGLLCAACEMRVFTKLAGIVNQRVAILFLLIMATSPGMFHASVAYLPSSFSMYTTMLSMAAFMDWRGGLRTVQGIFWCGAGACLGWPFAIAMAVPFLVEEVILALFSDRDAQLQCIRRFANGAVRVLGVLAAQTAIDVFFYRKLVCVPLNIVWYNVFSGKGGPDLYGTEPWHFYVRNLLLNFHLWFLLALAALPLLLIQHYTRTDRATRASSLRGFVFVSPFYLWLAIFTIQPHKEERFMYPAYPALALNAAVALHIILGYLSSTDRKAAISKIPLQVRLFVMMAFVLTALALSAFRTLGTVTAYSAPLYLYTPLHRAGLTKPEDNICLGKEWYRFPTHHLLPHDVRARFLKSEFDGLLPGAFSEIPTTEAFGFLPGTWLVPPGMNDENREDTGKHTELKRCSFIVDSHLPSTIPTVLEPSFTADLEHWERVKCVPFLDTASTGAIGRLGWIPDLPFLPQRFRRVWGEQCLLKRRKMHAANARRDPVPRIETMG